jgi:hypothetical protein
MATVTECYREVEYTDEMFEEQIDELYPEVRIGGSVFYASDILKEMAPNDYDCMKADMDPNEEEIYYECNNCGSEYDYEYDAEVCCEVYECECCGSEYHSEEEADNCCNDEDEDNE